MVYRDESEALKARYESLSRELEQVRAQRQALSAHESTLASELDEARGRLASMAGGPMYDRADGQRLQARALFASLLGAGACMLLGLSALGRVMTSEIAPIEVYETTTTDLLPRVVPPVASPHPAVRATIAADEGMGFVWVEATEGTRIYEDEHFLGIAPLMFPAPEGPHVYSGVDPVTGERRAVLGEVRDRGVVTVHLDSAGDPGL